MTENGHPFGAHFLLGEGSGLVNLDNGFANGAVVQDLLLVDPASNQGGGAQAVDLARNAAGVLEDAFECIVAERGAGGVPGNAQVVLDVLNGFFEVQRRKLIGIGQALAKSFVDGQVQGLGKNRWADEQQGSQGTAVHVGAEEQAELLESGGR